jgi:Cof subfamily protein (haloacid dehalogenase superfamily)
VPRPVQAFACDLDGTLIGRDGVLRPRTRAAIARSQAIEIPVLVATGRMFRSVEPYLADAGIREPVVCYQGAAVVDPRTREFLLHEPLELEVAREAIATLVQLGFSPNVYVDDELFVAHETEYSRAYSVFQRLPVTEVGDLLAWLDRPPTKLVQVADPPVLAELRPTLERRLDGRVFLTTSLPYMLELGNPSVTKGSGIAFVATMLGLDVAHVVAFGDGENDVELLDVAGLGVAVESGHPRLLAIADMTCAGPEEEGVASVMEAVLDLDLDSAT